MNLSQAKLEILKVLRDRHKNGQGLGCVDNEELSLLIQMLERDGGLGQWWPAAHQLYQAGMISYEVYEVINHVSESQPRKPMEVH